MPKDTKKPINTVTVPTQDSRMYGLMGPRLNAIIQNLYSISLYDTKASGPLDLGTEVLDPFKRSTSAEFFFTVPPKVAEVVEPFATTVTATQNGGKFVESHGSILKEIKITGTTGFRPNKAGALGQVPLLTQGAVNQLEGIGASITSSNLGDDRLRNVVAKEATGYDDAMFLKNMFRKYSDIKASDELSSRILMLWRNAKDQEFWVVEPKTFHLTQNSASPLTYSYALTLTAISKFDYRVITPLVDPLQDTKDGLSFFARIGEVQRSLLNSFLLISSQIDRLAGIGTFAADTLLTPMSSVIQGLSAIRTSSDSLAFTIRSRVEEMSGNLDIALAEMQKHPDRFTAQDQLTRTMQRAKIAAAKLIADKELAKMASAQLARKRQKAIDAYAVGGDAFNSRRSPRTGGDPSYLGNEPFKDGVQQATVHQGDNIRALAQRLLGNSSRWQILVMLNDLRAPYISATSSSGVLGYGDAIIYPATAGASKSPERSNPKGVGTDETDGESFDAGSPVQEAYGRDIRLKSVPVTSDVDLTDFAVNQSGDIATVQGVPNVVQSVKVKFSTEQGTLPAHPGFGAKFPIGRKATPESFNGFRLATEATILSDVRVARIANLEFTATGDTVYVNAEIVMHDSSDVTTTSFAIRRL